MPKHSKRSTVREAWASMSLADRVSQLSARRREIIRPAMEDPRQFVLLSVRDMAKRLRTDPATTVRIARGMGFASYKEFQHYLHELSVVRTTSLDTMQSVSIQDSSVKSFMRACLDQDLKNFRALYNGMDLDRVEAAARRAWKARRILVIGGDAAACLVSYLEYHLNMLGLPVFTATSPGHAVHIVRNLGREDLLMAVSFRRGLRMTIEGIQQARKLGAFCIGVTDTYISPVARYSDEVFLTPIDTTSFGASYSAPLCFFNVFLAAVIEVERTKSLQIMKKVADEQRHGFRFYEEMRAGIPQSFRETAGQNSRRSLAK
jgi:DNA-binding MurR/RpiR family transcriptional regulator